MKMILFLDKNLELFVVLINQDRQRNYPLNLFKLIITTHDKKRKP